MNGQNGYDGSVGMVGEKGKMNFFFCLLIIGFVFKFFTRVLKFIWVKVFKNGPSKICGRQPLKNLK